jgi:hypothetical protein
VYLFLDKIEILQVKKGSHLKNFISMVATDTMAIGGSDIAKDLLRVNSIDFLYLNIFLLSLANGRK